MLGQVGLVCTHDVLEKFQIVCHSFKYIGTTAPTFLGEKILKPNHLPDFACALCAVVLSVAIANAGFRGEENPPADAAGGFLGGLTVTTASTVTTSAFLSVSPSTLVPDGILEQSYDVSPQT